MLSDKGTNIFSEIDKFFKENDATREGHPTASHHHRLDAPSRHYGCPPLSEVLWRQRAEGWWREVPLALLRALSVKCACRSHTQ